MAESGEQFEVQDAYVPGHLLEALVNDERVGEHDLQVDVVGHRVVISGTVASEERRQAVAIVAHELLPDWDVSNHVDVVQLGAPIEREELP